jgi:hypothetical protein
MATIDGGGKRGLSNYIAAYDVHYGSERKWSTRYGKHTTVPTHNLAAIHTMFEFMEEWRPKIFLFGGDQFDAGEISHHNRRKKRLTEGFRFKDSLDGFRREILDPIEARLPKDARKIWLPGNHERFLQDFLDENPEFEGLVNIEEYLGLAARGWECYGLREIATIGKCAFVHGELCTSQYPASRALRVYQRSVRFGHRHSTSVAVNIQCYDRPNERHTAKGVPCLRSLNPAWMGNGANNWSNGFLAGTVAKDGTFTDFIVEMYANKFFWGNRVFDGKSISQALKVA